MKGIAAQKAKMKGKQGPKDQNQRNKPPGGEARHSKLSAVSCHVSLSLVAFYKRSCSLIPVGGNSWSEHLGLENVWGHICACWQEWSQISSKPRQQSVWFCVVFFPPFPVRYRVENAHVVNDMSFEPEQVKENNESKSQKTKMDRNQRPKGQNERKSRRKRPK